MATDVPCATCDLDGESEQIRTDNKSSPTSFRRLSSDDGRVYSRLVVSVQFRSMNSIRSVQRASLMVIIFFWRVSCLLLDCVGYQSSKAKWSIFSFCLSYSLVRSIARSLACRRLPRSRYFLRRPRASLALVNDLLTSIAYVTFDIELN